MIGLSAVRAGAAIGQWWTNRPKKSRPPPANNGATSVNNSAPSVGNDAPDDDMANKEYIAEEIDRVFLVLATLGQRLLVLDVVNRDALEEARVSVRQAFKITDPKDDDLGEGFDKLDLMLQYLVTGAAIFCAECYPMHMYRGFGCAVLDNPTWADLQKGGWVFRYMDKTLAYLKSVPHEWQLLKNRRGGSGRRSRATTKCPRRFRKKSRRS